MTQQAQKQSVETSSTPTQWALVIDHEYSTEVYGFDSEASAKDYLFGYVKTWWETETGESVEEMPTDRDAAVNRYFEAAQDENYTLAEITFPNGAYPA